MSPVLDVLVITTCGYGGTPRALQDKHKPFRGELGLDRTLGFTVLRTHLAEHIFDACEEPGLGYERTTRPFGQQVSIVRRDPPDPSKWEWDPDRRIYRVLALSRLIRPIPVGLRYCARVWLGPDGNARQIVPGPVDGRMAYGLCTPGHVWYLAKEDVEKIRDTLPKDNPQGLPRRVRWAGWQFDYLFYEYYPFRRWLFLCTALETLVHTDTRGSTKQFCVRGAKLAADAGMRGWSEARLKDIYEH